MDGRSWFVVTGRVEGDDEDTCMIVAARHAGEARFYWAKAVQDYADKRIRDARAEVREATPTETTCERGAAPNDCASAYNCCDCGVSGARFACCDYCFSCNACDKCR